MRYNHLDFAAHTNQTTLDIDQTLIVDALKPSHGEPTMSPEDMKLAILSLYSTNKRQQAIIDELVQCVNELRAITKKPRFRKK